ncbi:MAG: hypothetical protein Q8P71_01065 [bacterium]|nr:hypothetical protein [bacterium]
MAKRTALIQVEREERESNQAVIRRFTKAVRASGIVQEAKKKQFRLRPKSEQMQKRSALRRLEKKQEHEKLYKLGKVDDSKRSHKRRS